ncbi:MAG: malate dehydrogenase (quinone) [Rhodoluna sp.]|nr:malate dehydrogenase (quinone) [Rhodoluna sp.]
MNSAKNLDVALIGGGIMSATLGTFLKLLKPELSIGVFERLETPALESSNAWNNAGTGHAALCELNYMPDSKDGSLPNPAKAIAINEQFQLSRQFWAYLVEQGILKSPETFINSTPHMTFVRGAKDVDYLRRRYEALKDQPLFAGIEFSEDAAEISKWAPLLIKDRSGNEPIAATRIESGTDVDFGSITRQLFEFLAKSNVSLNSSVEVKDLNRNLDNTWNIELRNIATSSTDYVNARFVFVGAGGWALKLLQKSGIAEARGYGTFPVGGQWLRTSNPALVAQHKAKVYSQASVGAPPMSVPHLDTRVVDGQAFLLFGPYATANPKFLKFGSIFDLPSSLRPGNLKPYLAVALGNFSLIKYLVSELVKTKKQKFNSLLEFMPSAKAEDWELLNAGQRAQVIKKDSVKGGVLQFGTEVITARDGSISGLLGASPGASTAVHVMLEVLERCFPSDFAGWQKKLREIIPSFGEKLSANPAKAKASLEQTARMLRIK